MEEKEKTSSLRDFIKKIPNTKFIVDGFTVKKKEEFQWWFLSHFHADHYGGITKNKWKHGTIVCTESTKNLIKLKFGKGHEDNIKVLERSVIILFELPNDEIYLHTGDFRFSKEKFLEYPKLRELQDKKINGVFLDTTYCNPQYVLPTQENVLDVISTFVKNRMKSNTLFVIGSYTIGKERICEAIANLCHCKIFVTPEKYQILLCLGLPYIDIFTTNPNTTNVHFVNMFDISFGRLANLFKHYGKLYHEIIGIKPTGWTNNKSKLELEVQKKGKISLVEVPYSEHSAFNELRDFCETFDTSNIIPTVNINQSKTQIFYLKEYDYIHKKSELKLKKEETSTTRSLFDFSFLFRKKKEKEDTFDIKIEKSVVENTVSNKDSVEVKKVEISKKQEISIKTEHVEVVDLVEIEEKSTMKRKRPFGDVKLKKTKKLKLPPQTTTLDRFFKKK
eukprot:gene8545-369_t